MENLSRQDRIWLKSMAIGHRLGCHQMESRSFAFKGYQFPLCARCTGVLLGEITGIASLLLGLRIPLPLMCGLIAVMGIDWFIQYLEICMSTNPRRFITGTLCGYGLTYAYFYFFRLLFRFVTTLFLSGS